MHSIRGHLEVTDLAGDHVGVELWLLLGICLRLKYRNVCVAHQQRESAVEGTKLLHLVRAPSSRRCLLLEGRKIQSWFNDEVDHWFTCLEVDFEGPSKKSTNTTKASFAIKCLQPNGCVTCISVCRCVHHKEIKKLRCCILTELA